MVARNDEERAAEPLEKGVRLFEFPQPSAVREVSAHHDQTRLQRVDETIETLSDSRFGARPEMQVGDVEEAECHGRGRLYTQSMVDEPTEVFDDLYLGLRAGGALRKKRRGEPLTTEEQEALGRWEGLSTSRKAVAIGAFAVGTFGLGFTIGGLVFGRWRKA